MYTGLDEAESRRGRVQYQVMDEAESRRGRVHDMTGPRPEAEGRAWSSSSATGLGLGPSN